MIRFIDYVALHLFFFVKSVPIDLAQGHFHNVKGLTQVLVTRYGEWLLL